MFRVPFLEACSGCGSHTNVETEQDYLVLNAVLANIGDIVSCSMCECSGTIDVDEDGKFCHWSKELCEYCILELDERLDALSERIINLVRV